MKKLVILALVLALPALAQTSLDQLESVAESSEFTATSTNEEVLAFCQALAAASPRVHFTTIGKTDGGNIIPLLIIGEPAPRSPNELVNDPRLPVYIQANIHGGEVEGKEATQMFARDLAMGKHPEILEQLVVLIVPNYNADGNSHISPDNRYYQAGPDAVGRRQNDRNLDLNRDWIKLEARETNAVVTSILNKWDPVLIVDCHTTNGSLHKEPMTWAPQNHPNGDSALMDYTRTVLIPAAAELTLREYGLASIPYGNFVDRQDRNKGWGTFGYQGRYTTNYTGLRNRMSMLLESYVYAPYKDRIWATYGFIQGTLLHIAGNREEVRQLIIDADRAATRRWDSLNTEKDTLALDADRVPFPGETVKIETWTGQELYEDEAGRRRIRPKGEEITLEVPYFGLFEPTGSTPLPRFYALDSNETAVIAKLAAHGVAMGALERETRLKANRFHPSEMTSAERHNQGHLMTSLKGEWKEEEVVLEPGTIIVSTAQPLGLLAAYLLEPEGNDGLTAWNYFDHRLRSQWGGRLQPHPVLKIFEKVELATGMLPLQ